ncbi:YbaY family lipoprotein [Pseudomarimonas salicorniae]|uniref:YbaY family lipoprotein n=1 Tax=Pseudomarimonas salicorniae TaxID=2933270 RepID=A0ABT0GGH9_9GAMM|nr:YbaY family lipoprotein [Lysobacter sp. CAU 1642]MCK7593648.1 YbaY family lipoprotein [Lysobacter sp. CAU 1642]
MRAPLFIALSAVLLAACGQQGSQQEQQARREQAQQGPTAPPPVPASATAIRGTLNINGLSQLPPGLQLRLRVLDRTDPSIVPPVVAERVEPAPASVPYNYALPYDPATINPDGRYVVDGALVAGEAVLYGTPNSIWVLTQGEDANADIGLERGGGLPPPDMAPADLLRQEFDRLERSIGGMKRISGERIENDITVGWDAFADSSGIRFARQAIDYDKGGVVSFRFAYKDGQPWILAREQGGVVQMVGWAADGTLALNSDTNDKALDENEVASLKAMAASVYSEAAAKHGG